MIKKTVQAIIPLKEVWQEIFSFKFFLQICDTGDKH